MKWLLLFLKRERTRDALYFLNWLVNIRKAPKLPRPFVQSILLIFFSPCGSISSLHQSGDKGSGDANEQRQQSKQIHLNLHFRISLTVYIESDLLFRGIWKCPFVRLPSLSFGEGSSALCRWIVIRWKSEGGLLGVGRKGDDWGNERKNREGERDVQRCLVECSLRALLASGLFVFLLCSFILFSSQRSCDVFVLFTSSHPALLLLSLYLSLPYLKSKILHKK